MGEIGATLLSNGVIGGPSRIYASDAPEAKLQAVLRKAFSRQHMALSLDTLLIETSDG